MKVYIYIKNKPIAEYNPQELEQSKRERTYKAMKAAGYERVKKEAQHGILRYMRYTEAEN